MFTYVHILNILLLMTGYLVVFANSVSTDNIVITVVLILTAVILLLLPYLEFEEYYLIERSSASRLNPKRTHYLSSAVVLLSHTVSLP